MAQVTSTGGITAPATTAPATVATPVNGTGPATTKTTSATAGVGTTPAFKDDLAKATEKLQQVHHHGRAKIVAGAREGQYLNESGNKRDGQAFTMEYHGGRRWHVYGTGADRTVIAFAKPATAAAKGADGGAEAGTGTTTTGKSGTTTGKSGTQDGSGTTAPAPSATSTSFSSAPPTAGGAVASTDLEA